MQSRDFVLLENSGAFVPGEVFHLNTCATGPLAGLSAAVKDVFDVAGRRTGAGNPRWKETHLPASRHAAAVERLLDAGASLVGKTITVELAYGITGQNAHYGSPRNGAAPGRSTGGSSSGSASAVSNDLCEFAIGTDSGGSIRVPGSYCGLFGIRPSYGRIPLDGCVPFTPSFDTCGWFTHSAELLERVGLVLLHSERRPRSQIRLCRFEEAFVAAETGVSTAASELLEVIGQHAAAVESRPLFTRPHEWDEVARASQTLQAFEAWQTHGEWIERARPTFGADVAARFKLASTVTKAAAADALGRRTEFSAMMGELLGDHTFICMPTTPSVAPQIDADPEALQAIRIKTLQFTCVAGLAGLPQITIPTVSPAGIPCGLSLIAGRGQDEMLLRFVCEVFAGQRRE
jgi:amidase